MIEGGERIDRDESSEGASAPLRSAARHRRLTVTPGLVLGVVTALIASVPVANSWWPGFPVDDAYIAYAYSQNLATGHGLRLSAFGPPAEGFSDALWVFILAAGRFVGIPITPLAIVLGILLIGATAAATMALVRAIHPRVPVLVAALPGALIPFLPGMAFSATAGLETLLFAFLLALTLTLGVSDLGAGGPLRSRTHICAVLLVLTRSEGGIVWLVLVLFSLIRHRQPVIQLRAALSFLVPAIGYEIFRVLYFGELVPNTVIAKSGFPWRITKRLDKARLLFFWHNYPLMCIGAVLALLLSVAIWRWLPNLRIVATVMVPFFAFEVYATAGDGYPYSRYLFTSLPVFIAMTVAAGAGLVWWPVRNGGGRNSPVRSRRNGPLPTWVIGTRLAGVVGLAVLLSFSGVIAVQHQNGFQRDDLHLNHLGSAYGAIFSSDDLSNHSDTYHYALARLLRTQPANTLVATDEIGIVAYYSHVKVLDLQGLADEHIANLKGFPGSRWDTAYLYGHHPTFIVYLVDGNCLCLGLGSDRENASSPGMLNYHLADLMYDGSFGIGPHGSPSLDAILFEVNPSGTTVTSLDGSVPPGRLAAAAMPKLAKAQLNPLMPTHVMQPIIAPRPAVEAVAGLALAVFRAIGAGPPVAITETSAPGADCRVTATAMQADVGSGQSAALRVTGPGSSVIGEATTDFSKSRLTVLSVPIPADQALPYTVTLHVTGLAILAEPQIDCD